MLKISFHIQQEFQYTLPHRQGTSVMKRKQKQQNILATSKFSLVEQIFRTCLVEVGSRSPRKIDNSKTFA